MGGRAARAARSGFGHRAARRMQSGFAKGARCYHRAAPREHHEAAANRLPLSHPELASQPCVVVDQAVRLQVLRRADHVPAAGPAGRRRRAQRLRQVQHHRRRALGARRKQGQRAARRVDAGRDLQRLGQRKPASRASVELVFDNTPARAGGQWNQFTEIAVKRVLTRDGTQQLLHQQPAGAPPRRAGRVPRHRPRARAPTRSSARARSAASSRASPKSCACSSKRRPASPSTRSAAARPRTGSRTRART